MYTYNSTEANARRTLYGVSWVPYMVIDGDNDEGSVGTWQNHILSNAETTAPLGIELSGSFNYMTGYGTVNVELHPEDGMTGNYTMHVVLVEDNIYYMGSNGYPDHHGVMRDMIPTSSGTSISLESNVTSSFQVDYHVPAEVVFENARMVVFVQNSSRDVMNAASVYVTQIAPINIPLLSVIGSGMSVVNDDGDGKLNPGEEADFIIAVENSCDWTDAEGVTGYLTTDNPYVTITDGEADYDLIIACDFIENDNDGFRLLVDPEAPAVQTLEFELRLTANMSSEAPYEVTIPVSYSMDLFQLNFPFEVSESLEGGNAVVDLDGDGDNEVVVGGIDSLLHVIAENGSELNGFPFQAANKIQGAPAVGDLDNDGDLEVVFVARDGGIYVVQHDGSGEIITVALSYLLGTPALCDLDNDGDLEIVAGGFGKDLLVIHHDGTALPGWPIVYAEEKMSSGVCIADINGDGAQEIIVGTWGDLIHVYDLQGNELSGFPVDIGADIKASPLVADLDNDGSLEIVVGQDQGTLVGISNTGSILWVNTEASTGIRTVPAVADFDGDGDLEIIYSARDGFVNVVDHQGNDLAGWPNYLGSANYSSPVVADLDGDGEPEFFLGSDGMQVHGFHSDGSMVSDFPVDLSGEAKGTPTVADLDQDGNLEVILGTSADLSAVDFKAQSSIQGEWFTDRGNYHRTGTYGIPLVSLNPDGQVPADLVLYQNFPNPFNPTTTLSFGIPRREMVDVMIYDLKGRLVAKPVSAMLEAGYHSIRWNGRYDTGRHAVTGVYFARIVSPSGQRAIKMMLIK